MVYAGAARKNSKKGGEQKKEDLVHALEHAIDARVHNRPDIFDFIR
jgi:hypothetical protein